MQYEKATFEKILVGKIRELAEDMGCNCFITGCCLSLSLCSLTPSLCLCLSLSLSLLSFSFSPFSLSFPSSDSLSSLNPQPKLKPGIFLQEAARDLKEACASDPKKSTPEPVKAEKPRKETPKGRSKLQEEKGSDSEGSSAAPVPGAMKAIKDAKPGEELSEHGGEQDDDSDLDKSSDDDLCKGKFARRDKGNAKDRFSDLPAKNQALLKDFEEPLLATFPRDLSKPFVSILPVSRYHLLYLHAET